MYNTLYRKRASCIYMHGTGSVRFANGVGTRVPISTSGTIRTSWAYPGGYPTMHTTDPGIVCAGCTIYVYPSPNIYPIWCKWDIFDYSLITFFFEVVSASFLDPALYMRRLVL